LSGWASSTPRWSGSGFTRLVVELADLPGHPARAIARRSARAPFRLVCSIGEAKKSA
jgi:hypothetical protein